MERWAECVAKTQRAMERAGYGACLTFRLEHLRYLSPYRPPFSLSMTHRVAALVSSRELIVFVPQIDVKGLRETAAGRFEVEPLPINQDAWPDPLGQALDCLPRGTRIAVDAAPAKVMSALPDREFFYDGTPLEEARRLKTPAEVKAIRQGLTMVSGAIAAAWEALVPGLTELELAAIAEHAARGAGAEGFAFFAIVASNGDIARRRYPTDHRFRDGDFVFLDLGVVHEGYCAEFSRATVVGDGVSEAQRHIHRTAFEANRVMLARLRPGVRGSELDAAARGVIRATDLAPYEHRHVTGSGIGVMLQERPIISDSFDAGVDETIEAGMVLNIEPGVYHPEIGGLRAEDIVLVTEVGYELLTPFPYDERLL